MFSGSLFSTFTSVYPTHSWVPWKFSQNSPYGFWDKTENQRAFVEFLCKELQFNAMDDWYRITKRDIIINGGGALLNKHNSSPSKLLESVYPEHKWLPWRFYAKKDYKSMESTS